MKLFVKVVTVLALLTITITDSVFIPQISDNPVFTHVTNIGS